MNEGLLVGQVFKLQRIVQYLYICEYIYIFFNLTINNKKRTITYITIQFFFSIFNFQVSRDRACLFLYVILGSYSQSKRGLSYKYIYVLLLGIPQVGSEASLFIYNLCLEKGSDQLYIVALYTLSIYPPVHADPNPFRGIYCMYLRSTSRYPLQVRSLHSLTTQVYRPVSFTSGF